MQVGLKGLQLPYIVALCILIFIGCKESVNTPQLPDMTGLSEDQNMRNFLQNFADASSQIDTSRIQRLGELSQQSTLTDDEIAEVSSIFGFESVDSFTNFIQIQMDMIADVEEEYSMSKQDTSLLEAEIAEMNIQFLGARRSSAFACDNTCADEKERCIYKVARRFALGSAGCLLTAALQVEQVDLYVEFFLQQMLLLDYGNAKRILNGA